METISFASLAYEHKKKKTRREQFLGEMDRVIPWQGLLPIIAKYYPKAGNGRQPLPMEMMLRVYFMQQWYGLSDPAMEDALYDSEAMRRFAGIDLSIDAIPDETTILHFRHLLEKHALTQRIFEKTRGYLTEKGLLLKRRDYCRCHHHQRALIDQEPGQGQRRRHETDEKGQPVVFRHEGAYRYGYR